MSISAISSSTPQVQPQQLAVAAVKSSESGSDNRRAAFARNDGEAASQAAARAVSGSGHKIDIKA